MRLVVRLLTALNVVTTVSLIVYYTVVFLNATFTFDPDFTVSSVPFYDSVTGGEFRDTFANRLFFESWVFASDLLRIIVPITYAHIIGLIIIDKDGQWTIISSLILILIIVLEFLKAVWRGYQWVFCTDFQFCRNFDPSKCSQKFDCPANFLWLWAFWYNIAFLVLLFIYILLSEQYEPAVIKFYKNLEKTGISPKRVKKTEEETKTNRFYNELVRQVGARLRKHKKFQ